MTTHWLFPVLGWAIFGVWAVLLVPSAISAFFRTLGRLTGDFRPLESWPGVTVVVAARDEGPNIDAALRSFLASDYPRLRIVAVDDRSQDETGAIMDRLASSDERLQVIHVTELPAGWLGKNHALHRAACEAQSEFLLFTDGDVVFRPEAIRLAVLYTVRRKFDHLCLMPNMIAGSYLENSLVAYFGLTLAVGTQPWLVPSGLMRVYLGVGAFNLVRAESYRQAGGHQPIRMDVIDDIKLGKVMKRAGFRQDALLAGDFVRVKWQSSAWDVIRGLEKNAFASLDYSVGKLLGVTLGFVTLLIVPYVAVAASPDVRALGYVAALLLVHTAYAAMSTRWGGGFGVFPMLPVAGIGLLLAFWRSAILTLKQGGVRWRDTFYPLEELRKHLYR